MRHLLLCCLATLGLSMTTAYADGMVVPGATDDGIQNDCQITAELSVMLLKMKAKTPPDELVKAATSLLTAKGYKGSFGDTAFVANVYTGMALQMGPEADPAMAAATPEELENLKADHLMSCLKDAFEELKAKESDNPVPPPR